MIKIAKYSVMLNKKSVLNCVEEEDVSRHEAEINNFANRLTDLENYDCKLIVEYADPKNKHKPKELRDCKLYDVLEECEHFDIFNGADIVITDTHYFGLRLFGSNYGMDGKGYIAETRILIVPYDKSGRSLDLVLPFIGKDIAYNQKLRFKCEPNQEGGILYE